MSSPRSAFAAELRAILPIALPLAASNLAQMAMGLTNAIMVGHLGATALSAAGLGGALYFTIAIASQGVRTAVAPLAARAIGTRDHSAAGQVAAAGLVLASAAAVPIVALLSVIDRLLAAIGYDPGPHGRNSLARSSSVRSRVESGHFVAPAGRGLLATVTQIVTRRRPLPDFPARF